MLDDAPQLQSLVRREPAPRRISVMRNDSVVAAASKTAVTFYVNGVAHFTFFCVKTALTVPTNLLRVIGQLCRRQRILRPWEILPSARMPEGE
jgi:hypothetical protein